MSVRRDNFTTAPTIPSGTVIVSLVVPNSPEILRDLLGAIQLLTISEFWEESPGGITADDAVAVYEFIIASWSES